MASQILSIISVTQNGVAEAYDWGNLYVPARLTARDGGSVTSFLSGFGYSKHLLVGLHGSVPVGSTIDGVQLTLRRKCTADGCIDITLQFWNGATELENIAESGVWSTPDYADVVWGSESDVIASLTPEIINSENLLLDLMLSNELGDSMTAYLDYVELKVWCTEPESPTTVGGSPLGRSRQGFIGRPYTRYVNG